MWNEPKKEKLEEIPKLYKTEDTPLGEKIIYLHFFFGGSDWYIAEYDGDDMFWGFVILNNDHINSEWGYISFSELKNINIEGFEIDCETPWKPIPAKKIKSIKI